MSGANKHSAADISELMPDTQKSITLDGWLQNNIAKQIIAHCKGELM